MLLLTCTFAPMPRDDIAMLFALRRHDLRYLPNYFIKTPRAIFRHAPSALFARSTSRRRGYSPALFLARLFFTLYFGDKHIVRAYAPADC